MYNIQATRACTCTCVHMQWLPSCCMWVSNVPTTTSVYLPASVTSSTHRIMHIYNFKTKHVPSLHTLQYHSRYIHNLNCIWHHNQQSSSAIKNISIFAKFPQGAYLLNNCPHQPSLLNMLFSNLA